MPTRWRVEDQYEGGGPGIWEVVLVDSLPASVFADNFCGPYACTGLVVLRNEIMGRTVSAPLNDPRLRHLRRADDTPAWDD